MGITKKAISVGLSATMLATLLATAFAGSAFAAAATLTVTPATATVAPGGTDVITFTATGVTAGDILTASTSGGSLSTTNPITTWTGTSPNLSGTGTATFTAPSTAGTVTITYTDTPSGGTASATITVSTAGTPPTCTTGTVYGTAFPYCANLSTQVADGMSYISLAFGNAVIAPSTLSISVTGGYFIGGVGVFDPAGQPYLTYPRTAILLNSTYSQLGSSDSLYLASSTAGNAVVTVSYYTASTNSTTYDSIATYSFTAATIPTVSTSYSSTTAPSSIPASPTGDTGKNITTFVANPNNVAITVGATVTWTLSPLGYFGSTGSNTASTTVNSAGTYTSPDIFSTGTVGATTLTTSISYLGVTYTLPNATITFVGAPAKIVLSNSAYVLDDSAAADPNALLAVVTDAAGNAIKSGITLSAGSYTPANIFTVTPGAYSLTDGAWDISAVCSGTPGTATVTVTVPSGSSTITSNAATLVCADALGPTTQGTFTVSAKSPTVAPNGTDTISVNVKDDNGLPAPDGTSVSAYTNGVGAVVSGATNPNAATTSNGVATFTYLAPSNAASATVTVFVSNTSTGSAAVSLTIGTPAPAVSATGGSALGLATSGFTATTKVAALNKYVTWQFSFGSAAAGQPIKIWLATKSGTTWSSFGTALTVRTADANGTVTFHWRFSTAKWVSVRAQLGTTNIYTHAYQARWM